MRLSGLLRRRDPETFIKITALQCRAPVGSEDERNRNESGHGELEPGLQIPARPGLVNHGYREDDADENRTYGHYLHGRAACALQREVTHSPPGRPPREQHGGEPEAAEDQRNAYRAQGHADLPTSKH